ncbi:MAG: exosortase W [Nitrospirota bacterium]
MTAKERSSIGLFLSIFAICYYPVLSRMAMGWWEVAAYSHGFLIIPISLYLIWNDREKLSRVPIRPALFWGSVIISFAAGILIIGTAGLINTLKYISLIVMIPGLVLLLLGGKYLQAISLPLCYLIFMLPFFDFIGEGVYLPLQIFSAKLGTELLHLFGYAAYLDGLYIHLPKVTLEIAEECAGIRYLVSILAVGIPLAYLSLSRGLQRVGLVVSAIIIAILANGLRVMLVGAISYSGDLSYTHGPFHIFQGMFIAWIGFIVLFVGAGWLSRMDENRYRKSGVKPGDSQPRDPQQPILAAIPHTVIPRSGFGIAIGILVFVTAVLHFYKPKAIFANEADFSSLQNIGSWEGNAGNLTQYPFRIPGADFEKLIIYPDATGNSLSLYIGYFATQEQGKEIVSFASDFLYKGASEMTVGSSRINKTIIRDGQTDHQTLFWINQGGVSIANRFEAKKSDIWRFLSRRENNGAMVIVSDWPNRSSHPGLLLKKEVHFAEALLKEMRRPGY